MLWNRRYDDVAEPLRLPDASYPGMLAFARRIDDDTALIALDSGDALIAFAVTGETPPIGSRVRIFPVTPEHWRIGEIAPLGLGIDLRFHERDGTADLSWIEALRAGLRLLRETLDVRRERLAQRRSQLGGRSEPPGLEEIWREEMAALNDRVTAETDYSEAEQAALARARAKPTRTSDEEERKIVAARRRRFTERGNDEIARFREERWPAMRDRAELELEKYAAYRTEVVRLEDTLHRILALATRADAALEALDRIEAAGLSIRGAQFDLTRLDEPPYAEEMLSTIELLHAAIPRRAQSTVARFSGYRAPTAGPAVPRPPP